MPRPRLCRRVWFQPNITYFKPAGMRMMDLQETNLKVDEFEAVRLKDYLSLGQEEAAKKMNISQPTFHRLILSARKKISDAIVNGKSIRIEGGNFEFPMPQFRHRHRFRGGRGFSPSCCICPICGYQNPKIMGQPCAQIKCEKCGSFMMRGD